MKTNKKILTIEEITELISRFKTIDTFITEGSLAMPPKEKVIDVGQNELGYLSKEMPQTHISTFGLASCLGLYTRNPVSGDQVLAHIGGNQTSKTRSFGKFIKERKFVLEDSEDGYNHQGIYVLQSGLAEDQDVEKVKSALKEMGYGNIKILRKKFLYYQEKSSIAVIYDKDGKMYDLTHIPPCSDEEVKKLIDAALSPFLHIHNENQRVIKDPKGDLEAMLGRYFKGLKEKTQIIPSERYFSLIKDIGRL